MPRSLSTSRFASSRLLLLACLLTLTTGTSALEWEAMGPFGGDQFDIRIAPDQPNTLYALSIHGIHRSHDGGQSWTGIHTREMFIGFTGFNVDPRDSRHLHSGTWRTGIWESHDEGETWTDCSQGLPIVAETPDAYHAVISLTQDAAGELFASLGTYGGQAAPPFRVYRSISGCNDWVADDAGIEPADISPSQEIQTLLTTDAAGRVWAISYGAGVYRYEDGHWLDANGNLPDAALRTTFLAHDPSDSERMLLGTEDQWIFESLDSGESWTRKALPESLRDLEHLPLVYTITIDPNNSQLLIAQAIDASIPPEIPLFHAQESQAEGLGLYVSFDDGLAWEVERALILRMTIDASETLPIGEGGSAEQDPPVLSRIWYATTLGMNALIKFDHVAQTEATITEGIEGMVINRVWVHPQSSPPADSALLAMSEGFLFRYQPDTGAWDYYPTYVFSDDAGFVNYNWSFAADWLDSQRVYFSTGNPAWQFSANRGIYAKSLDCFTEFCEDPAQLLADTGVWQVISTPLQPETLYAATQGEGILVSRDRGNSWSDLSQGLPASASVTDLALDEQGNPLLAALRTSTGGVTDEPAQQQQWWVDADEAGAVYVFEAGGWVEAAGIQEAVLDLETHPSDARIFYAATSNGVFRSLDRGQAWESVAPGLLTYALAIDPAHPDYLYAATASGVLRSTTAGVQWHDLSDGLPLDIVHSLSHDPLTGVVYAGTGGNSIYRLLPAVDPQPEISFDPPLLEFGSIPVGFSGDAYVLLSNDGEAPLLIDDVSSADATFSVADSVDLPLLIPPRSLSALRLRFSPQSVGIIAGDLTFSSNDADEPTVVYPVRGEGRPAIPAAPDARVNGMDNPPPIQIGESIMLSVNLTAGDYSGRSADMWIGLTTPGGTSYWLVEGAGWVASQTPLRAFVAPIANYGNSLPQISHTPMVSGEYVFSFSVDDNADNVCDANWTDSVSFTVDSRPPSLFVAPDAADFGSVALGSAGTMAIGLGNTGEQQLIIYDIEVSDAALSLVDPPDFPLMLASGESTAVLLRYAPQQLAPLQTTLNFHSNADTVVTQYPVTGQARQGVTPVADARINGADPIAPVEFGQVVTFSVHLEANDYLGRDADVWVGWTLPGGDTYWLVYGVGWVASEIPQRLLALPIADYDALFSLELALPTSGVHQFTFAVDDNTDNVFDATWSDSVAVTVAPSAPVLVIVPEPLDFAEVTVGSSRTLGIGIGNLGGQDLIIERIEVGTSELALVDSPTMPVVLPAGEAAGFLLSYSPQTAEPLASSITVYSNGAQPIVVHPVYGQGRVQSPAAPDVRVDNADHPITTPIGQTVSLSTHLQAGDYAGRVADYWISMATPDGATHWLVFEYGWVTSESPVRFLSAPIATFSELFRIPFVPAAPGEHAFRFAVDDNTDGIFDATWSDTVFFTAEPNAA